MLHFEVFRDFLRMKFSKMRFVFLLGGMGRVFVLEAENIKCDCESMTLNRLVNFETYRVSLRHMKCLLLRSGQSGPRGNWFFTIRWTSRNAKRAEQNNHTLHNCTTIGTEPKHQAKSCKTLGALSKTFGRVHYAWQASPGVIDFWETVILQRNHQVCDSNLSNKVFVGAVL